MFKQPNLTLPKKTTNYYQKFKNIQITLFLN
jgi:hypothetical protein